MGNNIKKYSFGVASSYIYTIVTSIVALWLTPYTLSFVDRTHYGYYILLADILTWIGLLQFGVSGVFNSKAAMCIGKKDYVLLQKYTSTAQIMQMISAIMVLMVGLVLSFCADKIIDTTGISKFDVVVTFVIVSITSCISIIRQPFSALLVANKQIHIDNIFNLVLYLLQVGLTVLFLNLGYGIVSLAVSHLISVVVITLITYYRVKHLPFRLNFGFKTFDRKVFWEFLGTGIWFTIGGLGQIFIYKIDRFLIGSYISLTMVTSYYITSKLYDFTNIFFSNFVNISRPYLSQLYGENNLNKLRKLYDLLLNGSVFIITLLCTVIYSINQWFIGWWIKGDGTAYLGDEISLLLAIGFILQSAVLPNRALLASTLYKVRYQGLARVLEGCVKFVLSLILVRYLGIKGLLFASIISCISCSTIIMNYLSNKVLQSSFCHMMKNYIPYLSIFLLVGLHYIPNKIVGLCVIIVAYTLGAIIYWRYILDKDIKTDLLLIFKKKNQK